MIEDSRPCLTCVFTLEWRYENTPATTANRPGARPIHQRMIDMKTVPLSGKKGAGRVALVDDEDYGLVSQYTWHLCLTVRKSGRENGPYARAAHKRSDDTWGNTYMHKLLTGWPRTDHIDHNGLNNQRLNLRPATTGQNMANALPISGGTSPYRGVHWSRRFSKWHAQILVDGRKRHLGYFVDEEDAARAYESAYFEAWGAYSSADVLLLMPMENTDVA